MRRQREDSDGRRRPRPGERSPGERTRASGLAARPGERSPGERSGASGLAARSGERTRASGLAVALLALACAPRPAPVDTEQPPEVRTARDPLPEQLVTRLRVRAAEGGLVYWRLPGADGPRCESWRLVPGPGTPERGHLELVPPEPITTPDPSDNVQSPARPPAPATLRYTYTLSEEQFSLTAPAYERPIAATRAGDDHAVGLALTCVYDGAAITLPGPDGPKRHLVLDGPERFFLDRDACLAAGPADEPPGPDEVRPLGCAGALADPATRARFDTLAPVGAPDVGAALRRSRRHWRLRPDRRGALRCETWRHHPQPDSPRHGRFVRRDRDDHGAYVHTYAYEAGPGVLTLQGPTEVRTIDVRGKRAELVKARSCIVTYPVPLVSADRLTIAAEQWYLSRRACEAARRAGVVPRPAPMCEVPQLHHNGPPA
jgi:hypothetical protein